MTYVNDSSAVVPVTAGETATATGFIISPGALSELTQCCGENLEASGSAQVSSGLTDWDDAGLIVLAAGDADGDLDIVYTE